MPMKSSYRCTKLVDLRREAVHHVRNKFPDLQENSNGFQRAVYRRIRAKQ